MSSFKVYSIDQKLQEENEDADKKAILTAAARRRDAGQNERYFADVSLNRYPLIGASKINSSPSDRGRMLFPGYFRLYDTILWGNRSNRKMLNC